jgi:hypothetical protein
LPAESAVRSFFIAVLTRVRLLRLICLRRSLWRIRFSDDLWFGIQNSDYLLLRDPNAQVTEYRDRPWYCQGEI